MDSRYVVGSNGEDVGVIDMSGILDLAPGVVGGFSSFRSGRLPFNSSFRASYGDGYSANFGASEDELLGRGARGVLPLMSPLSRMESSVSS